MKILIIHHTGVLGGGTISCFDVANALNKNNRKIILSLPLGENAAQLKAQEMHISTLNENVMPLVFGYYNGGSNIIKVMIKALFSLKYRANWKEIFKQVKPDLVILNSVVQWPMISLLNSINIKNVCFIRETLRGNPVGIINRIIASSLQKTSGVAFLSQYDKEQWNLPESVKQTVIPDMLDIEKFTEGINKEDSRKKLKLKSDVFYVLYVGGMSKLKGAKTIIQAMNYFQEKNIELLFLGDLGTELMKLNGLQKGKKHNQKAFIKEMYSYIEKNNMNNQIHFIGMQKNMNYWYAACDVVVFPAEKAHQARPIYEAGAFSKPVIASDFPNYNEYLKSGVNGLLFEPGNYKELAQTINNLYKDQTLCTDLGKKNYDLTNSLHNSLNINRKIEQFIEEAIVE